MPVAIVKSGFKPPIIYYTLFNSNIWKLNLGLNNKLDVTSVQVIPSVELYISFYTVNVFSFLFRFRLSAN